MAKAVFPVAVAPPITIKYFTIRKILSFFALSEKVRT
jgi:hypothetical protein